VRPSDVLYFIDGLRQRDVEDALSPCSAFHQKMQAECGLARPRVSHDEIHVSLGKAAAKDFIQTGDAG
jgi:hypothetical protein